ncbi:MAG: DUF512 domain-containing protein [Thermoleophilia bacterium]|nr:DUF512 domain-containing protein [Thermoleophilia bacterium]
MNSTEMQTGGLVAAIQTGSPASSAGIEPGDVIISLDDHLLDDVIDYQYYFEPRVQVVELARAGQILELELDNTEGGDPGIFFSNVIFDRVRTCSNRCLFCFIEQVPMGLRPPLYLKDDDYRLSFLNGNFITLGKIRESDLTRIIEQRLSPLYISVHATDPEVRGLLMGCSSDMAQRGLANLKRLGDAGIESHIQIVLCPGINDGAALEQTINELGKDYPGVASVGVVPVALDAEYLREHPKIALRPVSVEDCIAVVDATDDWQMRFRRERGAGFVYAADEFLLRSGRPLPPSEYYDDFAQYENGVGISRSFVEEGEGLIGDLLAGRDATTGSGRVFLLTGTLAADFMAAACDRLSQALDREILPLVAGNQLFGPHVTVTGLLGGRDIIAAVDAAGLSRGDLLLVPPSAMESSGERFLDDLTFEELNELLPCEVISGAPY